MNKRDIVSKIKDLFIVREDDGSYNLFGRYLINPSKTGVYTVTDLYENNNLDFCVLRHAVTWCVFQKNNKYKEIKRIHELDSLLSGIDVSIQQHRKLAEKTKNSNDKFIYLAKLQEDKRKKLMLLNELNSYAEQSKYWQTKKFMENKDK
jgi:hypothetical protein